MASPSREILLVSSPEGHITAYDPSSGVPLAHFSGTCSPRKGLALAGKTLIAASHISPSTAAGSISLYNWWSSVAFQNIPVPEPVAPLASTSDGSFLFSGGLSGQIHTLSLPSGDLIRSVPAHRKPVSCMAVNDDSSLLISAGDDGTLAVFAIMHIMDVSSREEPKALYQIQAHSSSVTAVGAGAGGCNAVIVSCSLDCRCKVWRVADGSHIRTVRFPSVLWSIAFEPSQTEFYAGGSDGRVYVGAMTVGRRMKAPGSSEAEVVAWGPGHGGAVTAVAVLNQGRNLVSTSEDGSIRIWEVETGRVVRVFGQERGSNISDLVVATSLGGRRGSGALGVVSHTHRSDFSSREIGRPVTEVREMEEWLNVVVKDRRRAVDTLEVAIGTYERLFGVLLNRAKGDE